MPALSLPGTQVLSQAAPHSGNQGSARALGGGQCTSAPGLEMATAPSLSVSGLGNENETQTPHTASDNPGHPASLPLDLAIDKDTRDTHPGQEPTLRQVHWALGVKVGQNSSSQECPRLPMVTGLALVILGDGPRSSFSGENKPTTSWLPQGDSSRATRGRPAGGTGCDTRGRGSEPGAASCGRFPNAMCAGLLLLTMPSCLLGLPQPPGGHAWNVLLPQTSWK